MGDCLTLGVGCDYMSILSYIIRADDGNGDTVAVLLVIVIMAVLVVMNSVVLVMTIMATIVMMVVAVIMVI